MNELDNLRFVLREDVAPYFSTEQLQNLLSKNDNNVEAAAYEGLMMKAEDTTLQVSGLSLHDSSKYFLRLASLYRPINTGFLGGSI